MALRFLIGAAGAGKTHTCLSDICEELFSSPLDGVPLLFLVPEQATFQMERALLTHDPRVRAASRASVVSFSRLAYRILDETGMGNLKQATGTAHLLALQSVISENKDRLKLLGGSAGTEGFLDRLGNTLHELKTHRLDESTIEKMRDEIDPGSLLGQKLHDIAILFRAYHRFIQERAHEIKMPIELATDVLHHSAALKGAKIWIDGFSGFTPQEYSFLAALLAHAGETTISLCVDPDVVGTDDSSLWKEGSPDALFHPTMETLVRLRDLAFETGIDIVKPTFLREIPAPRYEKEPFLDDVAQMLASPLTSGRHEVSSTRTQDAVSSETSGGGDVRRVSGVTIFEASDARGEVEAAAKEIARLVMDEGLRYSDIAVIVRDLAPYREAIETTFSQWEFPYFLDVKDSVLYHPLIQYLSSALEIALKGWSTENVFRYFKSDLVPVEREVTDMLEIDAIARGLSHQDWVKDNVWPEHKHLLKPLKDFYRSVRRGHPDSPLDGQALRYVAAIRDLLDESGAAETMDQWTDDTTAEAREEAAEHRQVWDGVRTLLDETERVLGDSPMSFQSFVDIMMTAMKNLRIANVPPTVDQLLVGSIERSRQPDLKVAIIMGCNDGVFPKTPDEDPIFLDEERETLSKMGLPLGPTSRIQLYHEAYLVYIAMTRASQAVYLTYARSDRSGRPMRPSSFLNRMIRQFPHIQTKVIDTYDAAYALPAGKTGIYGWIARSLRASLDADEKQLGANAWLMLAGRLTDYAPDTRLIDALSALNYKNDPQALPVHVTDKIFQDPFRLSASRLESAAACAFQYFAGYTLGLSPKRTPKLDPMVLGEIRHATLSRFVEKLWREQIEWADMTDEQSDRMMAEALKEILPDEVKRTVERSATDQFILDRLRQGLFAFGQAMIEHAKRSSFRPVVIERFFGLGGSIPPVKLRLSNEREAIVQGRIDRVDLAQADGGTGPRYMLVIDYKSSARKFRLDEVVYGIDLQLVLYMLAVKDGAFWDPEHAGETIPAGVLYAPVFDPIARLDTPPEGEGKPWLNALKFQGMLLNDGVVPRLTDRESTSHSPIVPLQFVKSGDVSKTSSVATPELMDDLMRAATRVATELSEDILAGKVDIAPYYFGGKTPCTFCDFRPVCQFDPVLPTNRYRFLKQEKDGWALIKERAGGDTDVENMDGRTDESD